MKLLKTSLQVSGDAGIRPWRAAVVFLFALLTLVATVASAQSPSTAARFVSVEGPVSIMKGSVKSEAKVGDEVAVSDEIETGQGGSAKILMNDRSIIDIGPVAKMRLSRAEGTDESRNTEIDLDFGQVRNSVNKKLNSKGSYKVKTKAVAFSVRGTDFAVNGTAEPEIVVFEGHVRVEKPNEPNPVTVSAGQFLKVSERQVAPSALSPAEIAQQYLQARVPDRTFPHSVIVGNAAASRYNGRSTLNVLARNVHLPVFTIPSSHFKLPGAVLPNALYISGNLINYYPVSVSVTFR